MKKRWVALGAFVVFGLWLAWVFQRPIARQFKFHWNPEALGQWGDTFGALNALFSAFAFIAVMVTLVFQGREIKRQQEQIQSAREDQQTLRFEATFFRLLDLLRELRSEIRFNHSREYNLHVPGNYVVQVGEDALRAIVRELDYWSEICDDRKPLDQIEFMKKKYMVCVQAYGENGLSPYFRIVYSILRRVHEATFLTDQDKAAYGNLLRSQITSNELAIAGINGMVSISANFATYLTEYRMFKYLVNGPTRAIIELHYPKHAFEGRD